MTCELEIDPCSTAFVTASWRWIRVTSLTTTDSECWTEIMLCDSLRITGRAPSRTCTWTEVTRLNLNWSGTGSTACSGETLTPISVQLCSGNQFWVCDKTAVASIGTVALPNWPSDGEAGGSGAAGAGCAGPSLLEVVLAGYITCVKTQKKIYSRFLLYALWYTMGISHLYYKPSNIIYDIHRDIIPWLYAILK